MNKIILAVGAGFLIVAASTIAWIKSDVAVELPPQQKESVATSSQEANSVPSSTIANQKPEILSLRLTPSNDQDGWIQFQRGAKVVVTGKNLEKVELRYLPTGTGMGEEYPNGVTLGSMTKIAKSSEVETWAYVPKVNVKATNFWAVGYGADGSQVKSEDLGNVYGEIVTSATKTIDKLRFEGNKFIVTDSTGGDSVIKSESGHVLHPLIGEISPNRKFVLYGDSVGDVSAGWIYSIDHNQSFALSAGMSGVTPSQAPKWLADNRFEYYEGCLTVEFGCYRHQSISALEPWKTERQQVAR